MEGRVKVSERGGGESEGECVGGENDERSENHKNTSNSKLIRDDKQGHATNSSN